MRNLLAIIDEGINKITDFQGYLAAEVTSISGGVFFLLQLILLLFITSFPNYQTHRTKLVLLLCLQLLLELILPYSIINLLGLRLLRLIFIAFFGLAMQRQTDRREKTVVAISDGYETPRVRKVVWEVVEKGNR